MRELGQLMGQLQRQAFRKAYGKIWDLTMVEVSVEAIASLTQYYEQPLRCFTFEDFQLGPIVEEFEETLGCPLGGRKPYLFLGFYPSIARVAKVVKILAQELDRVKQNRNGVVRVSRKCLEEKAKALASQGEWAPFIDILALLIFGVVLFATMEGLVDLAAIDAFFAFHHSKESPVVAILADMSTRLTKDVRRAVQELFDAYLFRQEGRHVCPLQGHRSCAEKGKADWDQLLASVATYPSTGGRRVTRGCVFQERNTHEVATNVYLRKTSEKPEKT